MDFPCYSNMFSLDDIISTSSHVDLDDGQIWTPDLYSDIWHNWHPSTIGDDYGHAPLYPTDNVNHELHSFFDQPVCRKRSLNQGLNCFEHFSGPSTLCVSPSSTIVSPFVSPSPSPSPAPPSKTRLSTSELADHSFPPDPETLCTLSLDLPPPDSTSAIRVCNSLDASASEEPSEQADKLEELKLLNPASSIPLSPMSGWLQATTPASSLPPRSTESRPSPYPDTLSECPLESRSSPRMPSSPELSSLVRKSSRLASKVSRGSSCSLSGGKRPFEELNQRDDDPRDSDYSESETDSRDHPARGPEVRGPGRKPRKAKSRRVQVRCTQCPETFSRLADSRRHFESVHVEKVAKDIYKNSRETERLFCDGCHKILSRPDARRRHERSCEMFSQ